jgi:type IV secretory pathway VirB10-like protein
VQPREPGEVKAYRGSNTQIMSSRESTAVSLPRAAFAGLIVALSLCLLAIAFLLGRESREPLGQTPRITTTPVSSVAEATPEPNEEVKLAVTPPPAPVYEPIVPVHKPRPTGAVGQPERTRTTRRAPEKKEKAASQAAGQPSRRAVRKYFDRLDAIMASTPMLDDPNAFAHQLLQESLQGNTSSMDQLLEEAERALSEVRAITPPKACAEHHRLTVEQLSQAVTLLGGVGNATQTLDVGSLGTFSSSGQSLQAEAEKLQRLERKLRREAEEG